MKFRDIFQYALGATIVLCFFLASYLLIFNAVPEANSKLLDILFGALVAQFINVVGYFYGSSKGSADKTDIIANGKKPE
jgi:hypothetical protein